MERKAKITQEAVNHACEKLLKTEKNITVNAVIQKIGGSFSTVGGMVKTWKEEQEAKIAPVLDMPETVMQSMHKATADIWGIASSVANERVEGIQKEAEELTAKAKAELAEYTGEVSRLENALEQAKKAHTDTQARLTETQKEASELTEKNAVLKTQGEDRDKEWERLRADYEKLQAELIEIAKGNTNGSDGNFT